MSRPSSHVWARYGWALVAIALPLLTCAGFFRGLIHTPLEVSAGSAPSAFNPKASSNGAVPKTPVPATPRQNAPADHPTPSAAPLTPKRWLIVCLDGVPLSMIQSLWNRGHFREFSAPTAVVSSLPSDTETAVTVALHARPAPGYEHSYYDRAENRMRGGPLTTIFGAGIPYIQSLDYDTNGWFKVLSYLAPQWVYRSDLARFNRKFQASNAPVFLAHLATSDALLHVRTAEQAEPLILEFENAVSNIYRDAHGELGLILFSDHGDTETLSHEVPVESFLAARGWRIRDSLAAPRDVVIPAYGLVGFAAIYCQPESIERLAEDLRGVQGADVIVSHEPGLQTATIRAADSSATAQLAWSGDGRRYRYTARGGDPLGLAVVFDDLRAKGKLDTSGFAEDDDLFAATSSSLFPDSAARVRDWATDHVRNPADVLVSFRPGYDHGSRILDHIVTLVGTHGGLEKSASLAFAMATYPLAPSIRLGDLLPANLLDKSKNQTQR